MKRIRVLSFDPGTANFGFSVVEYKDKGYRLVTCGLLKNPMKMIADHKQLKKQSILFSKEVKKLLTKNKIDSLCIERFQPRGISKSTTIELVNMMIGMVVRILVREYKHISFSAYMPATWKNSVNKQKDLKELYKLCGVAPHELDSSLMGVYHIERTLLQKPKQFLRFPFKKWNNQLAAKSLRNAEKNNRRTVRAKR